MSGIALYRPQTLMIGDPGPALEIGLWQMVLEQIEEAGLDPYEGYAVAIEHEGAKHIVTGVKSRAGNAVHCDDGDRNLGEYETDTGHLAIMPTALCCKNPYQSHARWISVDETTAGYVVDGKLILEGRMRHCQIATVPCWAREATATEGKTGITLRQAV